MRTKVRIRIRNLSNNKSYFQVCLSGSSRDRRKQFRALCRKYPDAEIKRNASIMAKTINGKLVHVEDANTPQTVITVHLPSKEKK